jgi:hypothetical protein
MAKDISKKTVALLVVLAIILSVFLTLINLTSAPEVEPITEDSAGAEIRVVVVEPAEPIEAQIQVNVVEGE